MAATARKPILYFIVFTVSITFYDLSNTTEHLRLYNCFMKTAGFYSRLSSEIDMDKESFASLYSICCYQVVETWSNELSHL